MMTIIIMCPLLSCTKKYYGKIYDGDTQKMDVKRKTVLTKKLDSSSSFSIIISKLSTWIWNGISPRNTIRRDLLLHNGYYVNQPRGHKHGVFGFLPKKKQKQKLRVGFLALGNIFLPLAARKIYFLAKNCNNLSSWPTCI